MRIFLIILVSMIPGLWNCSYARCGAAADTTPAGAVIKIEMDLSAFGVESDYFPSARVLIDFVNDSNLCVKSFYNPAIKGCTYRLSKVEMAEIACLLTLPLLENLKNRYEVNRTDQPTSITKIYTAAKVYIIDDYGLDAPHPMDRLYEIVYKLQGHPPGKPCD